MIELLIVVAIIGILAAIAVPNFMDAKLRAELARLNAHVKATSDALELYRLDWRNYIPTQPGHYDLQKLTTPMAYLNSLPQDQFLITRIKQGTISYPDGLNWDYTGSDLLRGWNKAPICYTFGSVIGLFDNTPCIGQMVWADECPNRWRAEFYRNGLYDMTNGLRSAGCVIKYGGDDSPLRH